MLPNFICPGAQKAATTFLFNLLKQHPSIYFPHCKETHYFDNPEHYRKGLDFYEDAYFAQVNQESIVGEITPEYIYFENVPGRIYTDIGPEIKFVFIFRNPVDRAYSQYWGEVSRGIENKSFEEAISLESQRLEKGYFEKAHFSYIDRGFYSRQLERYLKYFDKQQMKFILFQDLIGNTEKTLEDVLDFFGVNTSYEIDLEVFENPTGMPKFKSLHFLFEKLPENQMIKKIGRFIFPSIKIRDYIGKFRTFILQKNRQEFEKPDMEQELRRNLINLYSEDINKLQSIIERDLSSWMNI